MRSVKHILLIILSIALIVTQMPFGALADDARSEDEQEIITIENGDPETDPTSYEEGTEDSIGDNNETANEEIKGEADESTEEPEPVDEEEP